MADKNQHGNGQGGNKGKKGKNESSTVKSLVRDLLGNKLTQPLSGKGLQKYISAGAKLRYSPLQNELDAQQRAEQATQQRNKAYYNDYLGRVRNIQGQTSDTYNQANSQLAQVQQQANSGDTGLAAILNQNRQAQAQQMGAPVSNAINPLAQAQVARSGLAAGNQDRIIGQGATQNAYLGDQRRIGSAQKVQTLIEGQDRIRSVRQDKESLAREKGAFKADMLRDLREGERGFLVDLISGPNARKLAHIQGSEARKTDNNAANNSSSSSSSTGEKPNKGKNRRATTKVARDARIELQSINPAEKSAGVGALTEYLVEQGYGPRLAARVARRFAAKHKGGKGGKGGGGGRGGRGVNGQVGGTIGNVGGTAGGRR